MKPLNNHRHELFAQNVAKGMTLISAYAKAGYMPHRQAASLLMTNVDIKKRVEELQLAAGKRTEISIAKVLKALSDIGFTEMSEVNGMHVSTKDRLSALEKIGKHLAMFTDKTDHISSDGSMTPQAPASVDQKVVQALVDKLVD